VDALDYHDYTASEGSSSPENNNDGPEGGRGTLHNAMTNLTTLGKTNLYLTEVGLAGASSLGWPKPINVGGANAPPYN